jgi:hypothetical protein
MLTRTARAVLIAAFMAWPIPTSAQLRGGAGREEIAVPTSVLPLDGFTQVHDPLQARVVLLDDGNARAAITVIDQTSIFEDLVANLQASIGQASGTDPGDVLVIASHTFSAPHAFAPDHLPPGVVMSAEDQKRRRLSGGAARCRGQGGVRGLWRAWYPSNRSSRAERAV